MKTHVIALAVLLAACVAPRAERPELLPEEPPDESAVESRATATCTREQACALDVVEMARRRAELEADTEAKMAEAKENTHMKKVAESWMQTLARTIADERERFSKWCDMAHEWNAARRGSGAPGLTTEDVLEWTGKPTREMEPESRDGSVEATAWTWEVSGPISRDVSFAILFMRPAGTNDPFIFGGCQWCASGGPATSPGCVTLPVKKP
jgi:hypothetical protein